VPRPRLHIFIVLGISKVSSFYLILGSRMPDSRPKLLGVSGCGSDRSSEADVGLEQA
jgi:hypothetical protein